MTNNPKDEKPNEITEITELTEIQKMLENSRANRDFIRTRFAREFEQMQLEADELELAKQEKKNEN